MTRDPFGLGPLLYAMRPAASLISPGVLLAMGGPSMALTRDGHRDCAISVFCRNPLHPGPCKGWKKSLGAQAPGVLTAIEKARKTRVAERRAKRDQARSTAAGGLTKQQLASPLHAKKATVKQANVLLGDTPDKARAKADRVILSQPEIKRFAKMKAAQIDGVAQKYGLQLPNLADAIASALKQDNAAGRDMAYRATLEALARTLADDLARKICKRGDGDCDGKPFEDLKRALEEGFRPAVTSGDDAELDDLVKTRAGGKLLAPTGKNPYVPTKPRPPRPGPVQGPSRPNAAQQAQAKKAARVAQQQAQQQAATPSSTPAAPAAPSSPAVSPPASPAPAAPLPATASAAAKHAQAVATRSAPKAGHAKTHLEAYGKLTKAEFDALPQATQDRIKADLVAAHGKFLDPKKRGEADAVYRQLTGQGIPTATAGKAPSAPAAAPPSPAAGTPAAPSAAPNTPAAGTPNAPAAPATGPPSPAATPSAPAAPNAKAVKAAELGAQIHEAATGKRMNAASKDAFAKALEGEHAKGDSTFAKAYADKAGADIARKTQTYLAGHSLTTGQLAALKQELAEAIDGKRDDLPLLDAIRDAWRGNMTGPELSRKLDAISAPAVPAAPAAPSDPLQDALDAARKLDDDQLHRKLGDGFGPTSDPATRKRVDDLYGEVAADTSRPAWLRLQAAMMRPVKDPQLQQAIKDAGLQGSDALRGASDPLPGYPTTYMLGDMFSRVNEAKLASTPGLDLVREAINLRRSHIVKELHKRGTSNNVITEVTGIVFQGGLLGNNRAPDLRRFNTLDPDAKLAAEDLLKKHVVNLTARGMAIQASEHETVLDRLESRQYSSEQADVIHMLHDRAATWQDKIGAVRRLTPDEFDALPDGHKTFALSTLEQAGNNATFSFVDRSDALDEMARLERRQPRYSNPQTNAVVKQATYHNGLIPPSMRGVVYANLPGTVFDDLKPGDESAVLNDMVDLAGDTSLGTPVRLAVQQRFDALTRSSYSAPQRAAIDAVAYRSSVVTNPANQTPPGQPADRIAAYSALPKSGYDALPPAYQRAIHEDLEALVVTHPHEAGVELARLDPSWTPPAAPAPARTTTNVPAAQAALDVIYGTDPKATTTGRQLQVYTGLTKGDFDGLQLHEQQTLLADLSYIATTSKSAATKTRAGKLLDRFTPPGTQPGTPGAKQPIVVPPNAVAGQVPQADPRGVPGLLKPKSGSTGTPGDAFTTTMSGGRGPWGKYGAAGIMLRNVDQHGVERFLMVERGPGISHPGQWQYPGGAIDSLETPYEGGTREVLEELGFKAAYLDGARVHGHHENLVPNIQGHPNGWKYTSIVATVDTMEKPDLSGYHAKLETSDAKWMTRAEIDALDRRGKLLDPIAGGRLQRNVMSMFPQAVQTVGRPGPVTQRPARATPPAPPAPYKRSIAKNLIPDAAGRDAVSALVKGPNARGAFSGKVADERLAVIHREQGFDRTPTVMSQKDMDALLATGDYIEVWRGVKGTANKSAAQIAEDFRTGPNWGGFGIFGNGYYFAGDKALAENYAGGGWRGGGVGRGVVMRALIPKAAVIEKHSKIEQEQQALFDSTLRRVRSSTKGGRTLHDEGRFASAKGVDSIEISVRDYKQRGGGSHLCTKPVHIVQNRSILIVQEA